MDAIKLKNSDKQIKLLDNLNDNQRAKDECKCDAYFIIMYPPEYPELYDDAVKDIEYWSKWFAHDRENNPKGLIEFDLTNDYFDIHNCNGGGTNA